MSEDSLKPCTCTHGERCHGCSREELNLEACPFCGNRMLVYMDDSDDGCRTYYGTCNLCDMRTEDFKKEQELLEYLNTRPIEDALTQSIRELEEQLAEVKWRIEGLEK